MCAPDASTDMGDQLNGNSQEVIVLYSSSYDLAMTLK
jgi:hypothetical protein